MSWKRDGSDKWVTWYFIPDFPIGVHDLRDNNNRRTGWTIAYVEDGLPAGGTNQYQVFPTLAEAQAAAERNGRVRVHFLGNQILVDGRVAGHVTDGDSESGYGLSINGARYECDAPDANGFALATLAD